MRMQIAAYRASVARYSVARYNDALIDFDYSFDKMSQKELVKKWAVLEEMRVDSDKLRLAFTGCLDGESAAT